MKKDPYKICKNMDEIERLRVDLYKHWNSIIKHNITEEILLMSEELDRAIVNYYQKDISDTEIG
ncbi:Spo0E family sporulation regulatory protein-aspartic acid phosphatase [Clostridium diolis]|uniref:Spo0E family sporulation regulatory protein-aspartic acid phosphatase n=1 Tax=Clostridium diolis TaxID=223919 RepID=A0AAV3VCU2_9CLOT|nr:Spo0E family sporulation regulatory protein-aspartic acid phosphatase [Clostridium diolis]GEA32766.1 hypothetical protein CDIOL_36890 [Clostridium diolis]